MQECIGDGLPKGGVCLGGVCLGVCLGGSLPKEGVCQGCLPGECLPRAVSAWGVCQTAPLAVRMTDTCKNITLRTVIRKCNRNQCYTASTFVTLKSDLIAQ